MTVLRYAFLNMAFCLVLMATATYTQDSDEEHWTENPNAVEPKKPQTDQKALRGIVDVRCMKNNTVEFKWEENHVETRRCCNELKLECSLKKKGDEGFAWFEDLRCHVKSKSQLPVLKKCCLKNDGKEYVMKPLKAAERKNRFSC